MGLPDSDRHGLRRRYGGCVMTSQETAGRRQPVGTCLVPTLLALACLPACAPTTATDPVPSDSGPAEHQEPPDWPSIAEELLERKALDQFVRSRDFGSMTQEERREAFAESSEVDAENTEWLRTLVAQHGWPTVTRVGPDASAAAFLLAQHADADPAFQAEMLPVLERAGERGEVNARDVAYLTDRVRVKQARPQVYGTQYYVRVGENGAAMADAQGRLTYLLPVVENVEGLDERRAEAGLDPWSQYEARMAASQGRDAGPSPRSWNGDLPVDPQTHP